MPSNQSRGTKDLSRFDSMTNEELEEILRLDAQKTEGEASDVEQILYIMEVLAGRKRNSRQSGKSAEEALKIFKDQYMPEDDSDDISQASSELKEIHIPSPKPRRWLRSLTAMAASLAILFLCAVTANAFGYNIWEAVAKWTRETFHFGNQQIEESGPSKDDETLYAALQSVLDDYEISVDLVPTWFPEGYEFVDVQIEESPVQRCYVARYKNHTSELKIQIVNCIDADVQQIEQSDGLVETYESDGVTYYLFTNLDVLKAVWINENYECYISGGLTMDELKTMIDSIGKG